jgi:hypothetical protein
VAFAPVISSPKESLGAILPPCLISELYEPPYAVPEPRKIVFWGRDVSSAIFFSKQTISVMAPFSCPQYASYKNYFHQEQNSGQPFVVVAQSFLQDNLCFGAVLLQCLISEPQKPPSAGIELRAFLGGFERAVISYCSHEISVPSLMQIRTHVLGIQASKQINK